MNNEINHSPESNSFRPELLFQSFQSCREEINLALHYASSDESLSMRALQLDPVTHIPDDMMLFLSAAQANMRLHLIGDNPIKPNEQLLPELQGCKSISIEPTYLDHGKDNWKHVWLPLFIAQNLMRSDSKAYVLETNQERVAWLSAQSYNDYDFHRKGLALRIRDSHPLFDYTRSLIKEPLSSTNVKTQITPTETVYFDTFKKKESAFFNQVIEDMDATQHELIVSLQYPPVFQFERAMQRAIRRGVKITLYLPESKLSQSFITMWKQPYLTAICIPNLHELSVQTDTVLDWGSHNFIDLTVLENSSVNLRSTSLQLKHQYRTSFDRHISNNPV